MIKETDTFYLNKAEPIKSCLLALRAIILAVDPHITESLKWQAPCFSYNKKMFCFLWVDKKTHEPYMLMVEGRHLIHPALETGKRSRMKILRVNPNEDLPVQTIKHILQLSLDLRRNRIIN